MTIFEIILYSSIFSSAVVILVCGGLAIGCIAYSYYSDSNELAKYILIGWSVLFIASVVLFVTGIMRVV